MCQPFSHFIILLIFLGSPGSQAIHISVIHTECSGNKYRMVNLHICSTFLPGILNIRWCYLITEDLDFFGNLKQSPEFVRNFSRSKVLFDIIDNTQIAIQIVRNSSSMRSVTKMTLILIGYPGGDHLAFGSGLRRWTARAYSWGVVNWIARLRTLL